MRWAVIIDESVSIGQRKLLLVLGLAVDKWDFSRTVRHQDVRGLHIGIAESWKSEGIVKVLRKVADSQKIAYCVSDKGNNIMGAIGGIKQIQNRRTIGVEP